ncbi:hypothetical protein BDC45DRAFT_610839 [Circinella umbellata]|nr:hypothetical protein BDC45DRAFT_610839 [Circinella umbellata]
MDYETIIIPQKPESVTSTTSSTDQPPSLYSGSSICDADSPMMQELGPYEDFMAIQIPHDDNDNQKATYLVDNSGFEKNLTLSQCKHVTIPASPGMAYDPQPLLTKRRRPSSIASSSEEDIFGDEKRFKACTTTVPTSPTMSQIIASRELLTEEEKRANHIASEQKRRNTIRNGFKDMTDIIPTLKNINNSKSTILFKAVEYIRHLEKRNRNLREKIGSLHMRVEVKRRMGTLNTPTNNNDIQQSPWSSTGTGTRRNTITTGSISNHHDQEQQQRRRASDNAMTAALMLHKNQQQKQLELLQNQFRVQQELLAKHNIPSISIPSSSEPSSSDSTPCSLYERLQQEKKKTSVLRRYDSISIPSSEEQHNQQQQIHNYQHNIHSIHQNNQQQHLYHFSSSVNNGINIPSSSSPSAITSTSTTSSSSSSHHQDHQHHHHHRSSSSSSSTPALVVPASTADWDKALITTTTITPTNPNSSDTAPSFNIPADDEFHQAHQENNALLSRSKLELLHHNHNHKQ